MVIHLIVSLLVKTTYCLLFEINCYYSVYSLLTNLSFVPGVCSKKVKYFIDQFGTIGNLKGKVKNLP